MIDPIMSELMRLATEMNSLHNDGWSREIYHRQLIKYREYIEKALKEYKE